MKFIHTADLHLDSPFLGLKQAPDQLWDVVYHSTFDAFARIVDDAIAAQVDFMCISGDIYDREQRSVAAENFFITQCMRLNEANIPVYLSYGNHDYKTVSGQQTSLPANVHVFGNEVETMTLTSNDDQRVAISGFSYPTQWLTEDQTANYPVKGDVDFQIGMLHGSYTELKTPHDNYAPFTLDELLAKKYDYWALGHIHKRQILHEQPVIAYSGNPQGRHKNEAGPKGYYLVENQHGQLVPEFEAVAPIDWQTMRVEVTDDDNVSEFIEQIKRSAMQQSSENQISLLNLQLIPQNDFSDALKTQINNGTILGRLQNDFSYQTNVELWPYELTLVTKDDVPQLSSIDQQYWDEAAQQVFTSDNVADLAQKLFQYDFIEREVNQTEQLELLQQKVAAELQQGGADNAD